jgi:Na+/H+-dicarboxylate symporter
MTEPPPPSESSLLRAGLWGWWHATPLYLRILYACIVGAVVGIALRECDRALRVRFDDATFERIYSLLEIGDDREVAKIVEEAAKNQLGLLRFFRPLQWATSLAIPSRLVLRLLGALAAPLVLVAVVQALMQAQIPKGSGLKLVSLLLLNTTVAILIGLTVANTLQPGKHTSLGSGQTPAEVKELKTDPIQQFLDNVPKSLLGPFTDDGKITSVILIAVALGIALRRLTPGHFQTATDLVAMAFDVLLVMLHWVIEVIPLAVFGIVARIVAISGFAAFQSLGLFVLSVLLGLALHLTYYLLRIRFGSWCRPLQVLRGMRDALVMAFSTASSTATMPVTYACLREKVGLREQSASLGALVGANFNNDGTALYQAMAAIFVAQLTGHELTMTQQLLIVLTSIAASVGAAGIPEAGTVTMTLIFKAVGLDLSYIPVLLTVDWFLDRCRTAINIMGDVNVSCLLDGYTREAHVPTEQDRELADIA